MGTEQSGVVGGKLSPGPSVARMATSLLGGKVNAVDVKTGPIAMWIAGSPGGIRQDHGGERAAHPDD